MQKIDQEKLTEFTHQLSEFQTEANKTASVDVYDRFTISKLEDHVVDLYQLSIDAAHQGLQFLCQHMRDNIRNHSITGTNISEEEFALMAEWKSLVKAYLVNNDNPQVVEALATNLSKPGWVSPLNDGDNKQAISVLLDQEQENETVLKETELNQPDQVIDTEFDAYMQESNSSLADVFQSSDDESVDEENINDIEGMSSLFEDDEPSLAECFQDLAEDEDDSATDDSVDMGVQGSIQEQEPELKQSLQTHEEVKEIHVSNEELSQIKQPPEISSSEPAFIEADVEEHDPKLEKDEAHAEAELVKDEFNKNENVEKVDVSEEELAKIKEPEADAIEDDLFVENSEHKDSSLAEEVAIQLPNAQEQEKIEVSEEELAEIDEQAKSSLEDDLFVEDSGHEESEYNEEFDKDLSAAEAAIVLSDEQEQEKIEISEEELAEIDEQAKPSLEDDLFVEDSGHEESEYNEEFDKDLSVAEAAIVLSDEQEQEKVEISEEELAVIETPAKSSLEEELFVADAGDTESEYNEKFDEDLSIAEAAIQQDGISEIQGEMSIAEEAIADVDTRSEQYADASNFVDTVTEKIMPVSKEIETVAEEETAESKQEADNTVAETVYIEPVEEKQDKSRSIIEAYVDVISNKKSHSKPDELEQELIEDPVIEDELVELEPIENILEKYSDWTEEQKELLSLILSEVNDVIEQQDETLTVLHDTSPHEESVLEMVSLYSEQIERMGSAAEMVGLDALQKLCELIGFHFGDLVRSSTEMIVKSEERIRKWPFVIYNYLKDIYNESAHQEAIDYISHDDWARTIREDIKSDLKQAFSQSTILIEHDEDDQRLSTATEEHVDISVPTDVQAELLDGLLQELPHQTEEFSTAIQELVNEDYLNQLEVAQRIAHTIKGAANTVGIVGVATLTHQLEDILQALLKAQTKPSAGLHNALVDASDCLEQMTEYLLDQGDRPDGAVQTLQIILDWANYIDEFGAPQNDDSQLPGNTNQAEKQKDTNNAEEKSKPAQEASLRVPANMIDELINQSGESIIANSQMHENVTRLLHSLRDIKKNREDVYTMSQQLEHMIDVQGITDKFAADEKNEKFDPLEMDQYNELHTYSRRLIEATADSVELVKDLEERLYSLESVIADQSRAQKDNQYAILKTRMAPVDSIVARLKRGVRQSSKLSDKSVELEVLGTETLLDNKILNNLIDPLMHILRNAVDHGVEADAVRQEQEKPVPAIITLSFEQVGERLEITCQDDGQGLDAEQIKTRALDKGMIDEDQQLTEQEIHQIIMRHGFSTRDQVTQLSGRGVGMDVVYSNIKELNGSVQIHSEKNKGMKVEMSLPVSLLTAHALLIPTFDGTMAVSTSGIEEILQVNSDNLTESEQGLVLKVEQEEYPAVHLEQLLKMRLTANQDNQNYSALLIESISGEKRVVLVNEIQSVRDIIIKPFSHYLPKVVGLVGATVLGNGDVAAVVDVGDLLSQQLELVGQLNQDISADIEAIHQASVLVVEDSISTRRSLAEFMQDLNYKVFTAKDGVEAIEVMRQHRPNILLTDLEMPRMNGLELTSYVRSHDETKDIPIIMLTSRTTEKHKQEAKSIGVNEYLTKPYVEDILLEKVQHLSSVK